MIEGTTQRQRVLAMSGMLIMAAALSACAMESKPAASPAERGPVRIQFWHALSGADALAANALVERFNGSQRDVLVEAIYQGSYDEALDKIKRAFRGAASQLPALVQAPDIATRSLIDSGQIKPVQDFIDQDRYSLGDYEPNLLATYQVNHRLVGMPFNASAPVLYFNKTAFKEVGLDPEQPPKTFEQVAVAAKQLTKKDSSGRVTRYGIAIAVSGWLFEEFLAVQNAEYANNGNGRAGLATALTFDNGAGVRALSWWGSMTQEGICANYGRLPSDTEAAFDAGRAAMVIDSASVLADRVKHVAGRFEIGTGFFPRPTDAKGGVAAGGAAAWILKGPSAAEQQAAWRFVRFLTSPAEQALWHIGTGYFPIRKTAYDDPADQEWRTRYPQFETAIDQLHQTPLTAATAGALLGVFPQARLSVQGAIEKALLNRAAPQQALKEAAAAVKPDLDAYNRSLR